MRSFRLITTTLAVLSFGSTVLAGAPPSQEEIPASTSTEKSVDHENPLWHGVW
jgi:hypothetical protein